MITRIPFADCYCIWAEPRYAHIHIVLPTEALVCDPCTVGSPEIVVIAGAASHECCAFY